MDSSLLTPVFLVIYLCGVWADSGHLDDCGPKGSKMSLSWSPSVIKPNEKVSISVKATAATDFKAGRLDSTVWIKGVSNPLYKGTNNVTCDQALPFLPGLFKCPIHKGDSINVPHHIENIPGDLEVPSGTYTVQGKLYNQAGALFACVTGDVQVVN